LSPIPSLPQTRRVTYSRPDRASVPSAFGWAVYLGASWTWCIGMFLPVLLVRDYGVAAWWIFAIPNVVGAAAMGWVLRRPESSADLVARHPQACAAFSWATIAFHLFFTFWMIRFAAGDASLLWVVLAALVAGVMLSRRGTIQLVAAVLFYAASVGIWIVLARREGLRWPAPTNMGTPLELAALAGVCVFGFLLCPYLDLTFHRARVFAADRARLAFGLGFGACFAAMIVFTLLYAHLLLDGFVRGPLLTLVAAHWIVQSGFTIAAHATELPRRMTATSAAGVVACVAGVAWALSADDFTYGRLSGGELGYRVFMAFYGLVFPAYVWLCVVPTRRGTPLTPRHVAVFLIAALVAAPLYWMAFVEGRMVWVAPALVIVLLARSLVGVRRTDIAPQAPPTGTGTRAA
jgi:hypothetical protein